MTALAQRDDHPETIARPPLIYLAFLIFGAALQLTSPYPVLSDWLRPVLALPAILAGIVLMAAAVRSFRAAGTNIPTPLPARALVATGPYRYTRNPMYLAMSLIYLGLVCAMNSLWMLLLFLPLHLLLHTGVIQAEEAYLASKFGDAYRRYCHRVRRWI